MVTVNSAYQNTFDIVKNNLKLTFYTDSLVWNLVQYDACL